MANNSHVNKYAKALFNASVKNNSTRETYNGLCLISTIIKSIPEFNHILFPKNMSRLNKKNILFNILSSKKAHSLVIELLAILIDNDECQLFNDIANKYNYVMNLDSKELDMTITSNIEFSSDKLDSIKNEVSIKLNKHINIKSFVDKKLLGGMKLRIGNTIIDNSLSNKLVKLKNNLKNNQANMELKNGN